MQAAVSTMPETWLQTIIHAMAEATLLVDGDGQIRMVNEAAAELFGHPLHELEGHPLERLIPPRLRAAHKLHQQAFLERPSPRQMGATSLRTPALRKSGETFDAKVSLSPLDAGLVLATVVDISTVNTTREALRKCAMILEQMGSAVVITDRAGDIEYVNPGFERSTGYFSDEVKGRNPRLLQSGETPPATFTALHQAMDEGRSWQGEFRNRRKDGSVYWESAIVSPIRDAAGDITHFAAVMDDISARKDAEAELARRESLLRLFIEHVPVALAMLDRNMRYLAVSQRWMLDYDLGDQRIVGRSHYEVFPELPQRWREVHQRGLAGATERMDDDSFVRRDGRRMWQRWEVRPWYEKPGEIGGILIFTEDITARKTSAQQMALSEERFRATFEQAAVGIAHVAPDGRWVRVNQKLCKLLRYTHDELLGLSFQDITHPDDLHSDIAFMARLLQGDIDHYAMDKRYIRKNGEPIWIRLTVSLVRKPDGLPDYFISVVEDIDARKRAEAELQRLRSDMEQVLTSHVAMQTAAAIAHELNQPLNAITSYTEAALRLQDAGDAQKERVAYALRCASEQAQRAGRVIRELMQLLHTREATPEAINLNEVVKSAIAIVQASKLSPFVTKIHLSPELGLVLANRLQVEKVMVNLLQNGVEAMKVAGISPRHITVTITTTEDEDMALVSVQDRGPGLTTESASSIFQPFFSTKKKGLGMGLAVSRALIEAQGGKLWLDLNGGSGATFRFTLPLVK